MHIHPGYLYVGEVRHALPSPESQLDSGVWDPPLGRSRSGTNSEAVASVIGDPAPQKIWHPRVKFHRGFGTPSVLLVSPTEQGIWHPMQNSWRIWHLHRKRP